MAKKTSAELSEKQKRVREASKINWILKGQLKNAQLQYLHIAASLIEMRDKKLYDAFGHASLEEYAEEHLGMKRASLYRYLQVYTWVGECHKEWLGPKPKGFIPELNDVTDLMWIERNLNERGLTSQARKELEAMKEAALEGKLRDSDLEEWRKRGGRSENALKTFLRKVQTLRRHAGELKDMPADTIKYLDAIIDGIGKVLSGGQK